MVIGNRRAGSHAGLGLLAFVPLEVAQAIGPRPGQRFRLRPGQRR
jgi:hypothetical protein